LKKKTDWEHKAMQGEVLHLKEEIEAIDGELRWKLLPTEQFEQRFVSALNAYSEAKLAQLICQIKESSFDWLIKKLWTEQDLMPSTEDSETDDAYARSMPFMTALKRCLLVRLDCEKDAKRVAHIQQQLAMISLILNPEMLAEHLPK
jgi:hypothetical protein